MLFSAVVKYILDGQPTWKTENNQRNYLNLEKAGNLIENLKFSIRHSISVAKDEMVGKNNVDLH